MKSTRFALPGLLAVVLAPTLTFAAPTSRPAGESIDQKTRKLASDWKDRLAGEKFNLLVAPPYVIAGDAPPSRLAQYRDNTILAADRALRAQFFSTAPDEPILILLFENADSYQRLAKKWFDDDDVPHYGFYRSWDRTMLMNVGTGTGTLVHELVHALIHPDFPDVPDWFNEGLASLYEQCSINRNAIAGLPNWRLPALQKAIANNTLRPLADLIADDDFRSDKRVGLNYAQARYLMLYLQEKRLLRRYYATFRAARKVDPTGLNTLKKLIAPQSLDDFDKEWRAWVAKLR